MHVLSGRGSFVFRFFDLVYRKSAHAAELTTFAVLISADRTETGYGCGRLIRRGIFGAFLDIRLEPGAEPPASAAAIES